MPIIRNTYVIGTHVYFFPEGANFTLPEPGGTVGRESKPDGKDPGWYDLGVIQDSEDQVSSTSIEIWKPSPGHLELYDEKEVKKKLTIKFKAGELSPVALQAIYQSQQLTEQSTQFNPLRGKSVKGFIQIQRYNSDDDSQVMLLTLYVKLKVTSPVKFSGDALVETDFEALMLQSSQNVGNI